MIQSPLQPQYKVRINVRPVKYAYFIREDDLDSLTQVIQLVCTQWGGIRSLIIPVRPDLSIAPLFEDLLKLHEPDWFVGYLTDPKASEFEDHNQFQRYLHRLWPHREINLQIGKYFEKHDQTAHALHVILDEDLAGNKLIEHEFTGSQTDHWILLALFGAIYPGQQEDYAETVRLKQRQIEVDSDDFWKSQFDNSPFGSVLNLTGYGVSPYKATDSLDSNHFDVVLVSSLSGLCLFWNFRATREAVQFRKSMGRRTLLLPERLLEDRQALQGIVDFVRASLPYPNVSANLHLRFCVWEETDAEKLDAAITALDGLDKFSDSEMSVGHTWGRDAPRKLEDLSTAPIKYHFMAPDIPGSYFEGVGHQMALSTELSYGHNEVFFNPPQGFRNRFRGATALDFECDVWLRYPKEHHIAESIKTHSRFSRYGLSLIAHTADRPHYWDFNLPSEWETLKLFFETRGYDIRISRPGMYANALIELLGGLQGVELLELKPVYLLLDTLALKSTKKLAQRIVRQLGLSEDQAVDVQPLLEDMEIVPELKRIPKTYRQLADGPLQPHRRDLLGLLAQLSDRQVVKRGFYLDCRNCGTPSWYPLQTVRETVLCPGCSYEFPLPVEYPQRSRNEIQWEYTLNTLVNRVMDQDALPAVLAIHHLTEDREACCVVPGLELLQSGNVKAELDFIFVSNQEVFAGECKAGTEIGEKDVETARLAADLGIHHFYYCTIKQFSETTQQRIRELESEFTSKSTPMSLGSLDGNDLLGEAIT